LQFFTLDSWSTEALTSMGREGKNVKTQAAQCQLIKKIFAKQSHGKLKLQMENGKNAFQMLQEMPSPRKAAEVEVWSEPGLQKGCGQRVSQACNGPHAPIWQGLVSCWDCLSEWEKKCERERERGRERVMHSTTHFSSDCVPRASCS